MGDSPYTKGPGDGSASPLSDSSVAGRIEKRDEVPGSRPMLQGQVGREIIRHMIWIPAGQGGADGTDDFLRRIRVMTSHVIDQGELRKPELGAIGASVGHGALGPGATHGQGMRILATVEKFMVGSSQDALHCVGAGMTGGGRSTLQKKQYRCHQ